MKAFEKIAELCDEFQLHYTQNGWQVIAWIGTRTVISEYHKTADDALFEFAEFLEGLRGES